MPNGSDLAAILASLCLGVTYGRSLRNGRGGYRRLFLGFSGLMSYRRTLPKVPTYKERRTMRGEPQPLKRGSRKIKLAIS